MKQNRTSATDAPLQLRHDDPDALALVAAVHGGDLDGLARQIAGRPALARARFVNAQGASSAALHAVCDWPGYFANGPAVVRMLLAAGADVDAAIAGSWHSETPLHWAASSDDVDVARALIDGGAVIETMGGSIGGGTPLDNAVGYGCWRVARLLVERGARVDKLWHAAGLGMTSRVEEFCAGDPAPSPREMNDAFWQACHGGHLRVARLLLERGADIDWVPDYAEKTPRSIAASVDTGREALITWLEASGAKRARAPS